MLSDLELRSGHTTARPVAADAQGRQPVYSIVVSNASSIEHAVRRGARLLLTAPLGATSTEFAITLLKAAENQTD